MSKPLTQTERRILIWLARAEPADRVQCVAEDPSVLDYLAPLLEREAALTVAVDDALTTFVDTKWETAYGYLNAGTFGVSNPASEPLTEPEIDRLITERVSNQDTSPQ